MSKNKNPFIKMAEMIPPRSNIAISTIYLAEPSVTIPRCHRQVG